MSQFIASNIDTIKEFSFWFLVSIGIAGGILLLAIEHVGRKFEKKH